MIRVEMHCHTRYSPDGFITEGQMLRRCRQKRIDCVFVADHNTMKGASEFAQELPLKIVPGQEIRTGNGEVIGLFLQEEIQPGLHLKETVERIRSQKGIVYLPHPFDEFRDSAIKAEDAERIKRSTDVIEVFNSRTFDSKCNTMALDFARENDICVAVGSDAHHQLELGNAYMEMDDFEGPEDFLESLRKATYVARRCPFVVRAYIKALKVLTGKN
jgi:predicted metal-dependent phosphoesterase TrpH